MQGVLTLSKAFHDQGEVEECKEDDIEFVEAREDAAKAFESAEEPFDLIALAVHGFVVLPRLQSIAFRRDNGNETEAQSQLLGFVIFVGAVHDEVQGRGQRPQAAQKFAAMDRVRGLARE